ncbi:MAG: hypothetical protein QGF90_17100, partial [Gammaproteobacteria bacterium]|nr:hypothetical protein [Gammaproteobacteria bacterium]
MMNLNKLRAVILGVCITGLAQFSTAQELDPRDDPAVQRVEPFQVFDNLYYVGAKWVSAWLLVSDQGLILFDS